jgi:mRNA interferase HigB
MHVISYKAIRLFKTVHRGAGGALDKWYEVTVASNWNDLAELKQTFPAADWVAPYVVFNVGGNKYRLIAEINFRSHTLFIRHILTHPEYDRGGWKQS